MVSLLRLLGVLAIGHASARRAKTVPPAAGEHLAPESAQVSYADLGLGQCELQGGRSAESKHSHRRPSRCERACTRWENCTGYLWSPMPLKGSCVHYFAAPLQLGPKLKFSDPLQYAREPLKYVKLETVAHCMVKRVHVMSDSEDIAEDETPRPASEASPPLQMMEMGTEADPSPSETPVPVEPKANLPLPTAKDATKAKSSAGHLRPAAVALVALLALLAPA